MIQVRLIFSHTELFPRHSSNPCTYDSSRVQRYHCLTVVAPCHTTSTVVLSPHAILHRCHHPCAATSHAFRLSCVPPLMCAASHACHLPCMLPLMHTASLTLALALPLMHVPSLSPLCCLTCTPLPHATSHMHRLM